ncbi:MAG: hypothetical protein IPM56_13620 [Ignavibacteriales bacterium]|nr:MAG: hypothetical protein IPM56_13620 [Ignavibacteriales bacterium]
MKSLIIIYYIFTVFWLFVPFRQYRTRFFLPFLLLALSDPIYIAFYELVPVKTDDYYLVMSIIFLYLMMFDVKTKTRIGVVIFFVLTSIPFFMISNLSTEILTLVIHAVIFIVLLRILAVHFSLHRNILIFHLVLVIYEFTLLLKFFVSITNVEVGAVYYIVTSYIQILFAIFFLIINENSKPKISFEKQAA